MAVKGDFSVRRALDRTYLYRFAVRKDDEKYTFPTSHAHEWNEEHTMKRNRRKRELDRIIATGLLPFPENKYIAEIRY